MTHGTSAPQSAEYIAILETIDARLRWLASWASNLFNTFPNRLNSNSIGLFRWSAAARTARFIRVTPDRSG